MEELSGVNNGGNGPEGSAGVAGLPISRPPSLRKQLSPLSQREDGSLSSTVLTPVVEAPFDEPIAPLPPMAPSLQPLLEDEVISDVPEEEEEEVVEQALPSVFDNVPPRPSRE